MLCVGSLLVACESNENSKVNFVRMNVEFACKQIGQHLDTIRETGKVLNARTIGKDGTTKYVHMYDYTSGFFPGIMWYMYKQTGDKKWKEYGLEVIESISDVQHLIWHHDVGFMIGCSFGNVYRLTGNKEYEEVTVQAARFLCARFRNKAGVTVMEYR